MSELPASWTTVSLSDVGNASTGNTPPTSNPSNYGQDVPYIKPPDLENRVIESPQSFLSNEGAAIARTLPPLAVLVTCIGNLGRVGISRTRVAFNQQINAVVSGAALDPFFLFYVAQSHAFRTQLESKASATTISIVNKGNFERITIPLPPLPEQKRIVAKIEELFSELEAGEESLRVARRQLGVYRQSLLKQAFEGKLTRKWRTQNPDKLECLTTLLARIQSERQSRYEKQLREWERNPKITKKPRAPKQSIQLDSEVKANLPVLPTSWAWITLGEIAETTVGFAFASKDFKTEGVRLLRGDNIEPRSLRWTNAVHWPESGIDEYRDLLVSEGNIILAMDRPVISSGLKVALAKAQDVPCLLVQRVARIIGSVGIENRFLLPLIDQQRFINHCLGHQTGTQLPHISEGQIRAFPVPACSLPEQQEIVRLLDEQFEGIERNEREIDGALRKSEALRQAILQKAFTGRLIPQDPADEPAFTLLARLRAERTIGGKGGGLNRKQSTAL